MKRTLVLIWVILVSLYSLGAEGRQEPETIKHPPLVLRLGAIKGPSGIGMVHLLETPPLLPGGDSISIELVGSADAIIARLLSGELDAAVLPINLAAKLYNSGMDYPLTAVVGNGMVRLITTDPSVSGIQDLTRRTIHVGGQASTPEYLLRTILSHQGLAGPSAPSLAFNMPIPEIAASIIAGRIDLVVVPEPFATMIVSGNPQAREPFALGGLWKEATGQADYPMTAFVVKANLIRDRPASIQALNTAYRRSIEQTLSDPEKAGELVERFGLGLRAPVAARAIPRSNYVFLDAQSARPMVESLLKVFLEAAPASVGGKLPDKGFYADLSQGR